MRRVQLVSKAVKAYDAYLYAQETCLGRIDIYRKSQMGMAPPSLIFSLTDTWNFNGRPVEWGIEVVMARLKAHDLFRDDTFIENWIKNQEKLSEDKKRDRRNNVEAFLYEFASQFQRATNDVNTAGMKKLYRKEN